MPMFRPILFGLLLLGACSTHSAIEQSESYASLGDYTRAYKVLDDLREETLSSGGTPSETLEEAHATARKRFLLESARWKIFGEQLDSALADLASLERVAPEYPELGALRERAIMKKAMQRVQLGDEMLLRKDLEGALENYLKAEALIPNFGPAVEGSERVRVSLAELSERSQKQFLEAVRKLPEFRYVEVRWHSEISLANEPAREDAEQLRQRAQREIALKAVERGQQCLDEDHFGAALLEFRTAGSLDPTLAEVPEKIAIAERELAAAALMEKAQIAMRSSRYDEARAQLAKAYELSTLSRGGISELMIQNRKLEGDSKYRAARDLEILGRKAEALAAFEAMAKEWPEGLSDEQARIDGLRLDIDSATKAWEAAEAAEKAGDLPGALLQYETAMQFYPRWKDGEERIARLKKAIAADDGGGSRQQ